MINEQAGFFWTMVTFSVAAVILFLITFATTKERVQPQVEVASTYKSDWYFLRTSLKLHQILLIGLAAVDRVIDRIRSPGLALDCRRLCRAEPGFVGGPCDRAEFE